MAASFRTSLAAALALATMGCGQSHHPASKSSVTIKLNESRPYKPEPGFSLATALPRDDQQAPRSKSEAQP